MGITPRVAFFADSFHEVNGLALTARSLDAFARRRALPFVCIRGSTATLDSGDAETRTIDLRRSVLSVPLDMDLSFDPLWPRHVGRVMRALDEFMPQVVHITGANDMGQLGAWIAHRRRLPLVASWHTNVHEFAARRARALLAVLPERIRATVAGAVERAVWHALVRFYRIPRALLVPNQDLAEALQAQTNRPVHVMRRGVDTDLFTPARRGEKTDAIFRLGYVGRLAPEKNVRLLAEIDRQLIARGARQFEWLVVGEGSERLWLEQTLGRGVFPGVLRGPALAHAYAAMDVFVFPSETDAFGNVVLEALASGVPALVTPQGGPQSIIRPGSDGFVAADAREFAEAVIRLMGDHARHLAMRRAARDRANEFSWDAVFERVFDVYGAVAEQARQTRHGAASAYASGAPRAASHGR
jgi:phosphatidylinositol alpha 1,6-mannosyltransferase